jgi:hypothetical protein
LKNKLYIFFKPEKKVFFYLLLIGPGDTFFLIFPDSFNTFAAKAYAEEDYILPANGNWEKYKKETGEYKIYFVVSKSRLKNLEKKIIIYQTNKAENSESGIRQLKREIIAEINQIQRDWFFSDNKHDPNSSMGTFRNDDFSEHNGDVVWIDIVDPLNISASAHEASLDKEVFIKIFTCEYE